MDNKEKIKLKIKALLAKTTDNGATEAEMIEAMAKASELMEKYYIDSSDLNDPFLGEKCVFLSTNLFTSQYDTKMFIPHLANLFDCEYYFNRHTKILTFFGFENDAELSVYFYKIVIKTLLSELVKYELSMEFQHQRKCTSTKTIKNSFIKGFVFRVAIKLNQMYRNRQAERTKERGLILMDKSQKVKDAFSYQNLKIVTMKQSKVTVERRAFKKGEEAGDNFSIVQGIKQGRQSSVKMLD